MIPIYCSVPWLFSFRKYCVNVSGMNDFLLNVLPEKWKNSEDLTPLLHRYTAEEFNKLTFLFDLLVPELKEGEVEPTLCYFLNERVVQIDINCGYAHAVNMWKLDSAEAQDLLNLRGKRPKLTIKIPE